jgi:hypothetical protein
LAAVDQFDECFKSTSVGRFVRRPPQPDELISENIAPGKNSECTLSISESASSPQGKKTPVAIHTQRTALPNEFQKVS